MNNPSNTTTSVAAALKAAREKQNAQNGDSSNGSSSTAAADGTPTINPATGKPGRAPRKNAKVETPKEPKVKVDDAWMAILTEKVNTQFKELLSAAKNPSAVEHGEATINFAVAKNKGIPVSLTPRIIYADGAIQSPGPKGRLGFCTDKKFDEWFLKVEEKLVSAMERKPRLKGKVPTKGSFWSLIAEKLRAKLGETYSVRSTGGRLTIHESPEDKSIALADWPLKAAFKQDGDTVILSSAKGSIQTVCPLLNSVLEAIEDEGGELPDDTDLEDETDNGPVDDKVEEGGEVDETENVGDEKDETEGEEKTEE